MRSALSARVAILAAALAAAGVARAGLAEDSELRGNLEMRLRSSVLVGKFSWKVEAKDGHVVLDGRVETLSQKVEAIRVIARTRDVVSLDDRIRIDTAGRADDAVAMDVRRRLEDKPRVAGAGIRAEVRGGVVRLVGTTKDASIRFEARSACEDVAGVVAVEDRIETPERPDEVILDASWRYFGRAATKRIAGAIIPKVEGGVVTLEGRVPRLHERMEAEKAMWGIEGVRGVVNRLEVAPKPGVELTEDPR